MDVRRHCSLQRMSIGIVLCHHSRLAMVLLSPGLVLLLLLSHFVLLLLLQIFLLQHGGKQGHGSRCRLLWRRSTVRSLLNDTGGYRLLVHGGSLNHMAGIGRWHGRKECLALGLRKSLLLSNILLLCFLLGLSCRFGCHFAVLFLLLL